MAEPQTGRLPKLGERMTPAPRSTGGGGPSALSCQWCSVPLPAGETICPTCGSPGAADETMIVPDLIEEPQQDAIAVERKSADELTEWWKEDDTDTYRNSASEENDNLPLILGLVGTGLFCILLGVLVVPILLTSFFESNLGITVESQNDLRPLGGVLGLLVGAFIGAIAMWVAAPRR